MKILLILLILLLPLSAKASETIHIGRFSSGDLTGWSEKNFSGKSSYTIVKDGEHTVLKAHSINSASGLYKKFKFETRDYPFLRWSWKTNNLIAKEDVSSKNGEDFAARVYVVFPRTFWRMRAIVYVWSSRMPKGSTHPSPYTGNAMIVAVESGSEKSGQWITSERNVFEDYRKLFGEDPPEAGAVAIMSDTDNTHEEVTAYYGDIYLLRKGGASTPALPGTAQINR